MDMLRRWRVPLLLFIGLSTILWAIRFYVLVPILSWLLTYLNTFVNNNITDIQTWEAVFSLISNVTTVVSTLLTLVANAFLALWSYSLLGKSAHPSDEKSTALVLTTSEYIRNLRPNGGQMSWIDRGNTGPNLLRTKRRLVIIGPSGVGKTREAGELIRQTVELDIVTAQIYQPGQALHQPTNVDLRQVIRKELDLSQPALFFVDDLPHNFPSAQLAKLSIALSAFDGCKGGGFFVATARSDQLLPEHNKWLADENVQKIYLQPLTLSQIGQLVDNTSSILGLLLDPAVRQICVESSNGLPGTLIYNLLRWKGSQQVDSVTARRMLTENIEASWIDTKSDMLTHNPAAFYLLEALAHFHMAGVSRYTPLVYAYASTLWPLKSFNVGGKHLDLQNALNSLLEYEIIARDGQIDYPDRVVQSNKTVAEAYKAVRKFLTGYRQWMHNRWLRRFHKNADLQRWAVADLAILASDVDRIFLYNQAIQISPHFDLYNIRGTVRYTQGELPEAILDFKRSIALNPNGGAYSNLGLTLYAQGKPAEAIAYYDKAIALNPKHADAYINRGNVYYAQGKLAEAVADFKQAITINSNDADAYNGLGVVCHDQGKLEEAIACYNKAIELNPKLATAYNNRGFVRHAQGKWAEAIADYTQAIELNFKDIVVYTNRGNAYYAQGEWVKASADYIQTITLDPDNVSRWIRLAAIFRHLEDDAARYIALQKARALLDLNDFYNVIGWESVAGNLDSAFVWLAAVKAAGQLNSVLAWEEPALYWIREDPRFTQIVGEPSDASNA